MESNKKTILICCTMFTKNQTIFVINEGQQAEKIFATIDNIPEMVMKISDKYDIKTVNIKGARIFTNKIGKAIQEKGITEYNKNLIINYIR